MDFEWNKQLAAEQDEAVRRELLLQRASELCLAYKKQGFHCSESSIRACSDVLDLRLSEDVIRSAAGFMGGGGNYGDRCGILESGCMLVSYLYGRLAPSQEIWRNNYLIRQLHERYLKNVGNLYCRDILAKEVGDGVENKETCNRTFDVGARTIVELLLDAETLLANIPAEEKAIDHYE